MFLLIILSCSIKNICFSLDWLIHIYFITVTVNICFDMLCYALASVYSFGRSYGTYSKTMLWSFMRTLENVIFAQFLSTQEYNKWWIPMGSYIPVPCDMSPNIFSWIVILVWSIIQFCISLSHQMILYFRYRISVPLACTLFTILLSLIYQHVFLESIVEFLYVLLRRNNIYLKEGATFAEFWRLSILPELLQYLINIVVKPWQSFMICLKIEHMVRNFFLKCTTNVIIFDLSYVFDNI